jgi:hypothetical protein
MEKRLTSDPNRRVPEQGKDPPDLEEWRSVLVECLEHR